MSVRLRAAGRIRGVEEQTRDPRVAVRVGGCIDPPERVTADRPVPDVGVHPQHGFGMAAVRQREVQRFAQDDDQIAGGGDRAQDPRVRPRVDAGAGNEDQPADRLDQVAGRVPLPRPHLVPGQTLSDLDLPVRAQRAHRRGSRHERAGVDHPGDEQQADHQSRHRQGQPKLGPPSLLGRVPVSRVIRIAVAVEPTTLDQGQNGPGQRQHAQHGHPGEDGNRRRMTRQHRSRAGPRHPPRDTDHRQSDRHPDQAEHRAAGGSRLRHGSSVGR